MGEIKRSASTANQFLYGHNKSHQNGKTKRYTWFVFVGMNKNCVKINSDSHIKEAAVNK